MRHTYQVMQAIYNLQIYLRQSESSLRGYMVASDESYLNEYFAASPEILIQHKALADLTRDNPAQQQLLRQLRPLLVDRVTRMSGAIQLKQERKFAEIQERSKNKKGLVLSREIESLLRQMILEEERLLNEREATSDAWDTVVPFIMVGGLIIFFVISQNSIMEARAKMLTDAENTRLVESLSIEREHNRLQIEFADRLASCRNPRDAYEVAREHCQKLFPGLSGAIYESAHSQSHARLIASWNEIRTPEDIDPRKDCRAILIGRAHFSEQGTALVCEHIQSSDDACCIPLTAQQFTWGLLTLQSENISLDVIEQADRVGRQFAPVIASLRNAEALQHKNSIDTLTGLHSRDFLMLFLDKEIKHARRNNSEIIVLNCDTDNFKQINDRYGHDAGDVVLSEIGKVLNSSIRAGDLAARIGGDELVLVLRGCSLEVAIERADEIREKAAGIRIEKDGSTIAGLTLSIGIAAFPRHGSTVESLLKASDQAMYISKFNGKDRVTIAS